MDKTKIVKIIAIPVAALFGVGLAFAGSQGSHLLPNTKFPIYAMGVLTAFAINWLAFIPAYLLKTEKFFDLTGSLTYISVSILSIALNSERDHRAWFVFAFVAIWACRLGAFLFYRIHKAGKDSRFDEMKSGFFSFLLVWTLQGLWVSFTLAAALVAFSSTTQAPLSWWALSGGLVWSLGFFFEVIADFQKLLFRRKPENKGEFIKSGLWSISRHPNYFGEIVLWIGIALMCVPSMVGWQFVGLISPVFVTFLLCAISGIPLLEKQANEKWGEREDYQEYVRKTAVLVPFLNCC